MDLLPWNDFAVLLQGSKSAAGAAVSGEVWLHLPSATGGKSVPRTLKVLGWKGVPAVGKS